MHVSTLAHYLRTRKWKPKNLSLKGHARSLGRALDLFQKEKQTLRAMDVVAGRLRALIHYDLTGSWKTAEQMESISNRDMGLADYEDLYYAKRMAKLTSMDDEDEDEGEDEERSPAPRKAAEAKAKGKKKKRGKKKKKGEEKVDGGDGGG
jgi:hypothetical protein